MKRYEAFKTSMQTYNFLQLISVRPPEEFIETTRLQATVMVMEYIVKLLPIPDMIVGIKLRVNIQITNMAAFAINNHDLDIDVQINPEKYYLLKEQINSFNLDTDDIQTIIISTLKESIIEYNKRIDFLNEEVQTK